MLPQNFPTMDQYLNAFVVGQFGNVAVEMIRQPLYDRQLYATAGVTGALQFFQQPIGSGISSESGGAATTAKSLADTNMTQQGQLPAPQAFFVDSIQVDFDPGSVSTTSLFVTEPPTFFNATAAATVQAGINDKNAVLNAGFLSFTVGQKNYQQQSPLRRFPPAVRMRADMSASMAGTNAQPAAFGAHLMYAEGAPGFPVFAVNPGVGIPTSVNFSVSLNFPIAIATPSGFNGRFQVMLDGWLIRAIQ